MEVQEYLVTCTRNGGYSKPEIWGIIFIDALLVFFAVRLGIDNLIAASLILIVALFANYLIICNRNKPVTISIQRSHLVYNGRFFRFKYSFSDLKTLQLFHNGVLTIFHRKLPFYVGIKVYKEFRPVVEWLDSNQSVHGIRLLGFDSIVSFD